MEFTVKSLAVPSSDGTHTLSGKIYIPNGTPRGVFHLVHGMTEYIGRFEKTMSTIAQNGFICIGYDNLGHGKTAQNEAELGFIAEKDGYRFLVEDVKRFGDEVHKAYPHLPYILMGHSMGSFIARLAAEKYGRSIDRLIICGTGGPMAVSNIAPLATKAVKLFKGARGYSAFLEALAFGSYNKRFEGRTNYDWLSTDAAVADRYMSDPLCGFHFTVSALCDLVILNRDCNRGGWFKSLRNMPILLISGADDPVGNYGRGVQKVYDRLIKSGHSDVALRLYDGCRHEIHNDTCQDEVLRDIIEFIN